MSLSFYDCHIFNFWFLLFSVFLHLQWHCVFTFGPVVPANVILKVCGLIDWVEFQIVEHFHLSFAIAMGFNIDH